MNLLLAAVLLTQDKTAEEAFKNIETALDSAKSVSIKYTIRSTSSSGQIDITGEMLLKGSGKAFISETFTWEYLQTKTTLKNLLVSDGTRVSVRYLNSDETKYGDAPNTLNAILCKTLTRSSMRAVPLHMSFAADNPEYLRENPMRNTPVPKCESHEEVGGKGLLKYLEVMNRVPPQTGTVKLWYDLESKRMLRRVFELPVGADKDVTDENFTEFTLNADIPDEKFKLPEQKK